MIGNLFLEFPVLFSPFPGLIQRLLVVAWQLSYKNQQKREIISLLTFHKSLFISQTNVLGIICEKCCAVFTTHFAEKCLGN